MKQTHHFPVGKVSNGRETSSFTSANVLAPVTSESFTGLASSVVLAVLMFFASYGFFSFRITNFG